MHADVLRRELADHQRAIAAWGIGAVLLTSLYILFYPTIHDSGAGIQAIFDTMPRAFRDAFLGTGVDFLSPNGYLGTELFSILVPALMLVMGILTGSRALAGEEQNGTIDLLLATPIRRRRLVTEKAVGAQLPLFVMAAFVWLAVALIGPSQGLSVNLGVLAIALIAVALLAAGLTVAFDPLAYVARLTLIVPTANLVVHTCGLTGAAYTGGRSTGREGSLTERSSGSSRPAGAAATAGRLASPSCPVRALGSPRTRNPYLG